MLSQWGNKIEALRFPLLVSPELDDINELMFREVDASSTTTGSGDGYVPSQYRERRRLDDLTGGSYFAPMCHDTAGNAAIDMSELEEKLRFMYERNERGTEEIIHRLQQGQRGGQQRGAQGRAQQGGRSNHRGRWSRGGGRPYGGAPPPETKQDFRPVEVPTST